MLDPLDAKDHKERDYGAGRRPDAKVAVPDVGVVDDLYGQLNRYVGDDGNQYSL